MSLLKKSLLTVLLSSFMYQTGALASEALSSDTLYIGASTKDITPQSNMYPLHRMPKVDIENMVLDPLHVRVIALSNGGSKSLIICSETGRSLGPQIAKIVSEHSGISLSNIIITATHSHAAPEISDPVNIDFKDSKDKSVSTQQLWAKYALEQTLSAVDDAMNHMQRAKVGIGYSKSYINVNRNATYNKVDKNGKVTKVSFLGYNPEGISDKTLVTLEFKDLNDKPIAFIVNYAVHGTVMHANTIADGKTAISADIPGLASDYIEDKYPGSVAMWLSGAAGDQNPIIQNNMYAPNPKTGEWEEVFSNNYDIAKYLAKIHFKDIETSIEHISQFSENAKINSAYVEGDIPSSQGGDAVISLQSLRIGKFELSAFPGELFTSTGAAIKSASPLKDTMIINHSWQRWTQSPNYHADDATIAANGFGADRAYYKPGYLNKVLSKLNNELIKETNEWTFNGDGTATNIKNGKIVIIGLDNRPGTSDDNKLVNTNGAVLFKNVVPKFDSNHKVYVDVGNGISICPGADNVIGTTDDVVCGFGHYRQNDENKASKIQWRLLGRDDSGLTVISNIILDAVKFNLSDTSGNEWKDSNLRAWLNSTGGQSSVGEKAGFINNAFNAEEKSKLVLNNVDMQSNEQFIAYNRLLTSDWWHHYSTHGFSTRDYVYVLSGEEVFKYFGKSKLATEKELGHSPENYSNAYFKASPFAIHNGIHINEGGNGPTFVGFADSWTRSKGAINNDNIFYGVFLGSTGSLNSGRPVTRDYGVLPVIKISLK